MKEFIEIPFGAKDSELCGWEYTIPKGFVASIENGKIIVKKEEDYEDERIRKKLIEAVKGDMIVGGTKDKQRAIAWLEKQGQTFTKKDVDNAYLKGVCDAKSELEKQDEQKPINDTDEEIVEAVKNASVLDLIEPKFKVGDWIRHNVANFVFQVTSVGSHGYEVVNRENYTHTISFDNEDNYYLWTIQDAKDGDVLAVTMYPEGTWIGMFKEHNGCTFSSHCFVNTEGTFKLGTYNHGHGKAIHPATKEQRDLLFQKMHKAGYEWDAEKKKLGKRVIDEGKAEMDYCFTKMMNGERVSPIWSEEDEEVLEDIRFNYEFNKSGMTEGLIEQYNKWFEKIKSLKPQPKWKPSEEQIQALEYQVNSTYKGSWQYKASKELLEQLKKL